MKGTDGKIYDIDFFMVPQPGKLTVTQTSVHKINRQTSLQLEATRGRLEKSARFVKRTQGCRLAAICLALTAHIHTSLWHRPRMPVVLQPALKTRFNPATTKQERRKSRFQRLRLGHPLNTWGAAPGWPSDDCAFGANHM